MGLPKDILESIFYRLSVIDIARSQGVCKSWRESISASEFLRRYSAKKPEKWVAVFNERGLAKERVLILYNSTLNSWHRVSLNFLPPEFTDAVAAAGGLLCVGGQVKDKYTMCVCNPLKQTYRLLPELNQESSALVALIIEQKDSKHFQVFILSGDTVSLFSTAMNCWVTFNTGLPYRPRSPVACDGVVYGLQNMGSPWQSSWRLVYARLNKLCSKEVWNPIYRPEWGEILDILRQPRLLEAHECLYLIGGLRFSIANNACSTFIILKLDLLTLEWSEAARMPMQIYKLFNPQGDFKVFGGRDMLYFSSKCPGQLVVCDLSEGEGSWRFVNDCPVYKYQKSDLCKGFPFDPRLDACPCERH